ncbi:DUF6417 family protein [Streptomyces sp. NBC_00576]|nr:DUF6417 family protein [Streptomyces sp. NBC_00576]
MGQVAPNLAASIARCPTSPPPCWTNEPQSGEPRVKVLHALGFTPAVSGHIVRLCRRSCDIAKITGCEVCVCGGDRGWPGQIPHLADELRVPPTDGLAEQVRTARCDHGNKRWRRVWVTHGPAAPVRGGAAVRERGACAGDRCPGRLERAVFHRSQRTGGACGDRGQLGHLPVS